jgi:predicted O-linked N-acetylglucosamine transferase (SPINDLY family)
MKTGRNDPCPCGSGKKYKQCCQGVDGATRQEPAGSMSTTNAVQMAWGHQRAGRLQEAEAIYRQVLQIDPEHKDALHYLGLIAYQVGKNEIAAELIGKAIGVSPSAGMCCNLGLVLQALGKLDAAIEQYRQAIVYQPNNAEAHNNLANALMEQGKLDDAVQHYRNALSIKPNFAEAHNNLGSSFQKQGNLEKAIVQFRKALSIKPDFAEAYSNQLHLYSFSTSHDPSQYLSLARGWEKACVPAIDRQLARNRTFQRLPVDGRRLRVGYVSGDFRQHVVSNFIEQVFVHHDRSRIELFAYSTNGFEDSVTKQLQASVEHWVSIAGMSDSAVLDRIESDAIDVLIDLSGHTLHDRLRVFACRAAPVQATYLGYFASTGLSEMDYWIGDEILTPPDTDSHFSERVWRLPRVWVSYKTITRAPEPNWRPTDDGVVWLGCFNNLGKVTPATLALWAKVLHALGEAKLFLKTKELADEGNRRFILNFMAEQGISAERIELQRETDWFDYMDQYNRIDIALDPVGGHSGGTVTCDALWMGVPVIHALGDRATSRFTASMLNAIGHTEWIAQSESEYVDKVLALARNIEHRKALRSGQRDRMLTSSLCDAKGLAMSLESAYVDMFKLWFEKQNS